MRFALAHPRRFEDQPGLPRRLCVFWGFLIEGQLLIERFLRNPYANAQYDWGCPDLRICGHTCCPTSLGHAILVYMPMVSHKKTYPESYWHLAPAHGQDCAACGTRALHAGAMAPWRAAAGPVMQGRSRSGGAGWPRARFHPSWPAANGVWPWGPVVQPGRPTTAFAGASYPLRDMCSLQVARNGYGKYPAAAAHGRLGGGPSRNYQLPKGPQHPFA